MQISQKDFDKLVTERDYLQARHDELQDTNRDQRNQINNFDEILDKIVRAANGLPLVIDRNSAHGMTPGYYGGQGEQHQCQIPGEIEVLRYELAVARDICTSLERHLSAAKAVAEFAKEHKA